MSDVVFIWEIYGLFIGMMNVRNGPLLVALKVLIDWWGILETPLLLCESGEPWNLDQQGGDSSLDPQMLLCSFTGSEARSRADYTGQNPACGLLFFLTRVNFHAEYLKNREHIFKFPDQVIRTVFESAC